MQSVVTQTSDTHFYIGVGLFNDCTLPLISPGLHIFGRGFRKAYKQRGLYPSRPIIRFKI